MSTLLSDDKTTECLSGKIKYRHPYPNLTSSTKINYRWINDFNFLKRIKSWK